MERNQVWKSSADNSWMPVQRSTTARELGKTESLTDGRAVCLEIVKLLLQTSRHEGR